MKKTAPLLPAFLLFSIFVLSISCGGDRREPADLVLKNGTIFTLDAEIPEASAIAITGNRIVAVFQNDREARKYTGSNTLVVDLQGAFVTPGMIDAHVHFNRAGALINDANLMTVSDEAGLREEIARVVGILDEGEWITEGLWGAYEQWALGDAGEDRLGEPGARHDGDAGTDQSDDAGTDLSGAGEADRPREAAAPWRPNRGMIDDLSPEHPVFVCRFDYREWLANTAALQRVGLLQQPLEGMEMGADGQPTGIILNPSPAYDALRAARAPKSHQRLMDENRAALKALRESGIVEVHDISVPDQEKRLAELQENGELTSRFWLRPDLTRGRELAEQGYGMGSHPTTKEEDAWLRFGALKGYIDGIMGTHGALFFEPYDDQPGNYGHWRRHTSDDPDFATANMEKMHRLIMEGLEGGFVPNVHAIGDRGVAEMLNLYERLNDEGVNLEGFRVIHAQVVRPSDFPRFNDLNVIAEVNPYHISDDMRWMEERIGHERCRGAYAFRSLLENGTILSFGSDWPGTSAAIYHVHPKYSIYSAVTRKTLAGTPPGGWFPEERISVEEAIRAYTINNALAALEDDIRGSITPGKLADITVFDRNLLEIPHAEILETEVVMTLVDGQIVFRNL
jgi:predicted amidohydrolase YtcJ